MTVCVTWSAWVALSLGLLLLPARWLLAGLLAAAVHELGHMASIISSGGRIWSLTISHLGARLDTEPLQPRQELLCALAGPGAGMCMLLFLRTYPELALCALAQSVYNLLPFPSLDGGRAVRGLLTLSNVKDVPRSQRRIAALTRWGITLVLVGYSLVAGQWEHGAMVLAVAGFRFVVRKTSCKE